LYPPLPQVLLVIAFIVILFSLTLLSLRHSTLNTVPGLQTAQTDIWLNELVDEWAKLS
jgi:hypothetical protein